MQKLSNDLTEGNPGKQLPAFALPFFISNVLQSVYTITDTIVVSRFIGVEGVAAINNGGLIMTVVTNVVAGLAIGGTVLTGMFSGAKKKEDLTKAVGSFLSLMAVVGLIGTLAFAFFSRYILLAIRTPSDVLDSAAGFLRIYGFGVFFIFGYNALVAVLRGIGNSRMPLFFVFCSAVTNIFLDLLFVVVFGWGINGAAIATTISIALSFALSFLFFLRQKEFFAFTLPNLTIRREMVIKILKIGIPSALQSFIFGLSFLTMNTFVNGYGVAAAATVGIGSKIDNFALMPSQAMSSATSAMVSQNIGARKIQRIDRIMFISVTYQLAISAVFFALAQLFPSFLFGLFIDELEVIALGTVYLRCISFNYLLSAILLPFNSLSIGSGNTVYPMCTTIMNAFVFRIPIALFFERVMGWGIKGVFLGFGFANLGGAAAGYVYYRVRYWAREREAV